MIESSTAYSDSVANYLKQKDDSIGIVAGKITEIDARLGELEDEKKHLDKRLSFLLERGNQEMAQSFMDEYQRGFLALRDEEQELGNRRRELQLRQKQLAEAQDPRKNYVLEQVAAALRYLKRKDVVSLKSAYRRVFKKIIVRPLDMAKVRLDFVFNNASTTADKVVEAFCARYIGKNEQCSYT